MNNLSWFIGVMAVLWIAWFMAGGPSSGRTDKPFLQPPAPISTGETYGSPGALAKYQRNSSRPSLETSRDVPYVAVGAVAGQSTTSPSALNSQDIFQQKVIIQSKRTAPSRSVPEEEYIELYADRKNTAPVNISGFVVKSAITGKSATIGTGTLLPHFGGIGQESAIFLRPGERAYVVTGNSPIGTSFRLNLCTGYFEQFQDFSPSLPRSCPSQKNEELPIGLSDNCLDYIERLPRCQAHITAAPFYLENACHAYLGEKVNYNGCVSAHKNDPDFYKPEWRIYLKRSEELWKSRRETILLLDSTGKTISSLSY